MEVVIMKKHWKRVVPTTTSSPANYFGAEREELMRQQGYIQSPFSQVVPTESSDFNLFRIEDQWRGVGDFFNRKKENNEVCRNNLSLAEDYYKKEESDSPQTTFSKSDIPHYPFDDKYEYITQIRRLSLDKKRMEDFGKGKGIKIDRPQGLKKDIKEINSIYSPLFGPTFEDASSFGTRYSCQCGLTKTQQYEGTKCPHCHTTVVRKEDDFSIRGWIILDNDVVIHCGLYKSIQNFLGDKILNNILDIKDEKDENGFSIAVERPENEPFMDYGMIGFQEHFDEIMNFYLARNPGKQAYYDDIMRDRDKVFTHSIPVFTTLLRPYHLNGDKFAFQDTNKNFNIMAMLGSLLNSKEGTLQAKAKKTRNQLLFDLQSNYNEVYDEVIKIMSSKKGTIRSLYGGRFNFTCRAVIVPNWRLRTDQIRLPFKGLVKLLEHSIINILCNSYGMQMYQARACWDKAFTSYDQRVWDIVEYIIGSMEEGIPFIINRNPGLSGAYRGDSICKTELIAGTSYHEFEGRSAAKQYRKEMILKVQRLSERSRLKRVEMLRYSMST